MFYRAFNVYCFVLNPAICHCYYFLLSAECASERILKIGQYLAKIWTKVKWQVILAHPVMMSHASYTQ